MATSHGHAGRRHRAGARAVAHGEGLAEDRFHARRKALLAMIALQETATAEQVHQTGLMHGLSKAAIRGPAVAHEHPGEVGAKHRRGLLVPATRLDGVDRGVGGRVRPEPLEVAADFPPGFIRADHRTAAYRCAQRGVGRLGLPGGAPLGVDQAPGGHVEAVPLAPECRDFAERHPELLVQRDSQCHGIGPELRGGRAERVGALQRMAPLHASMALRAFPDRNVEGADDGLDRREIFLILRRMPRHADGSATVGTPRRDRRVVAFIDANRHPTMRLAPIRRAGPAARDPRRGLRRPFRKRRGLPVAGAAGRVQLLLQAIDLLPEPLALTPPPIPFLFDARLFTLQALDLALLPLQLFQQLVTRRGAPRLHAPVMPDPRNLYKYKFLDLRAPPR